MQEILSDNEIIKHYELKEQIRYNDRVKIKQEDVAQHSYFVALLCIKIFEKIGGLLNTTEKYNILLKAILHDLPEIETSDIPYVVKKENPELDKIIEQLERKFYEKEFPNLVETIYNNNYKEDNIVKLADVYSVRQFCLQEKEMGNNSKDIEEILNKTYIRVKEM